MSILLRLALFMLASATISATVSAAPINLYEYQSLVTSQERSERNQVTSDGLAEVIVRASGQLSVLQDPDVQSALRNSSRYLVEYRYEATDQTLTIDNREVPASRLVLKYSSQAIEKLLRDLRLSIWPANRPNVLVWLVVDRGTGRETVSNLSAPEAVKATLQAATRRGLPLLSPLMDLEDQVALSPEQLWTLDELAIRAASQRYQPDAIMVGRLSQTSQGEWRSAWQLFNNEQSIVFDGRASSLDSVAAQGIDYAADYFFKLHGYQPTGEAARNLALQIAGVDNFADYVDVTKYLEGLAVIRQADVSVALGKYLLLNLATEVDVTAFQEALALDKKLLPEATQLMNPALPGSAENPLKYVWQ